MNQQHNLTPVMLDHMEVEELGNLTAREISLLTDLLAEEEALLKDRKKALQYASELRFLDKAMGELRSKTLDSGTAHVLEDGIDVVVTIPKTVDWNQEELAKSIEAVKSWGEDPHEYVTTKLSVSENAYKAWPAAIRKVFEPARTMAPGKPKFAFKAQKQKAGTF